MKKRIFKFAALILAIVTCLAIASTVTTAASRATHSTTASSYSANGFAQSNTCKVRSLPNYKSFGGRRHTYVALTVG